MGQWTDIAEWVGPTVNCREGAMDPIRYVILHIQEGTQEGSIAWCKDPDSQVSAHFFVAKTGAIAQLVDTGDTAWAEAAGNPYSISVECEGNSGDSLTNEQVQACGKILGKAHEIYEVPLVITDDPGEDGAGLGWHGMGGAPWGDHPDCPGEAVLNQRPNVIAAAIAYVGSKMTPAYPGFIVALRNPYATGSVVRTIQIQLEALHYNIGTAGVDGVYGPATAAAVGQLQLDHHLAGSIRTNGFPDEMVGPETWAALWQ